MKRRLVNLLTALSLLIFAATVVFWLRSYKDGGERISYLLLPG